MFGFLKKKTVREKEDALIYKTMIEGRGTEEEKRKAQEILAKRSNDKIVKDVNTED